MEKSWEDRYYIAVRRAEGAERERNEARAALRSVKEVLEEAIETRHLAFGGWCYTLIERVIGIAKGGQV